jgi:hypothetical protein
LNQALTQQVVGDARWNQETRSRWPGGVFSVSLLLVGTSYVLLLAAPLVSARLRGLAGEAHWQSIAHWIPAASGAGLALGGGAALLRVLAKLSKDIRRHPYACVAPALAAFAACVMIGLGAKLPLGPSEPLCVFALALSVMGGALVQESRAAGQVFGWSLTIAPTASLVAAVWAASGEAQLSRAIWALTPTSRLFLAMLALSSVSMALLGMVARALSASHEMRQIEARGALREQHSTLGYAVVPAQSAQWDRNPFPTREDTLDLDLRSAEAELRKRPLGRPLLLAACCLLVGIGAGLWHRSSTRSERSMAQVAATPASSVAAVPSAVPSQPSILAAAPIPQVEPLVPVAMPSVPEPAPAAPDLPALAVAEARASARDQNVETMPSAQVPLEAPAVVSEQTIESPIVFTSRAAHVRKQKVSRPRHKALAARSAKAAAPAETRGSVRVQTEEAVEQASEKAAVEAREPKPELAPREQKEIAKAAPAPAPAKKVAAPTRGDESLDELMDRVVENKRSKASSTVSADDPIFGL